MYANVQINNKNNIFPLMKELINIPELLNAKTCVRDPFY